jgi:hypothetical protein
LKPLQVFSPCVLVSGVRNACLFLKHCFPDFRFIVMIQKFVLTRQLSHYCTVAAAWPSIYCIGVLGQDQA